MGMARPGPLLLCHRSLCGGLRNTSATSCTCHSCRIQIRGSKCQEDTTESDRSGELRQPPRKAMQVVPSGSRLQESQRAASFSSSSSPSATSRRPSVVCSRSHQRYTRVCIRRVVVYWNTSLIYSIPYPWFISIPYSIRPLGQDLKSGRPYIQNLLLCKDQWWFFLCIFRTLPDLNFAAMENWAFHILEGTVFTLSNLSFAYLHGFSHFISFCLYLYREAERKITAGLYEGEVWNP
jgi:hypothetical protein